MASFSFYVQSPNVWQGDIPTQTMLVDCLAIKIFADVTGPFLAELHRVQEKVDWMIANELPRRQFCAEGVVKTASGCSFTHQIIQNHRIIKVAIAGSQGGAEHACYSNRLEMVISSTLYFVHFILHLHWSSRPVNATVSEGSNLRYHRFIILVSAFLTYCIVLPTLMSIDLWGTLMDCFVRWNALS